MPLEIFLALASFILVTSTTPGPNNIMLMASGVNFGFKRTLPHMAGVLFGFQLLLFCIALGLGQLLERAPIIYSGLKFAGGSYLLFLAYKIATSGPLQNTKKESKPLSMFAAAAFQWVNPKAWVVSITVIATYTNVEKFLATMMIVAAVTFTGTIISIVSWTLFGTALSKFLSNPKTLQRFNITMALLLVASLWPMLR